MSLSADFSAAAGSFELAARLQVGGGETVALVGPNGAGKTSVLRAVAGLLPIRAGVIRFDEQVLDDGSPAGFVPPEARGVGFVFQQPLLFPHLSVMGNVAFGLVARGMARRAANAHAAGWLDRVGLADRARAMPGELSGGQAQRVALARALATTPRILLLDEPLAAADATARLELRRELRSQLQQFAGVRLLVAHDAVDAFALADRIVVVEQGRVVQAGTVAEICGSPRSRYVADLVGLNCFSGTARDGVIELPNGARLVASGARDGAVFATVHPHAISLFRERPSGSPRNVWRAPVLGIEPALDCQRVRLGGEVPLVAEVTARAVSELQLATGGEVWVALKATEVRVQAG
ncbi:MAG: ABC transporter ATP-binding protein [Planctomycetes bacterium]|nr:ABC transporter ATP-binding protein [Planctomycetota bacterium]